MKDFNFLGLIGLILIVACAYGWIVNVINFCSLDFEESYKAEIIRGIGIPVAPAGIVLGYITFEEEEKTSK